MKTIALFFMVCLSTMCFAQDDDEKELPEVDENFTKYLEDGVHHDAGNFVSISATDIIGGFVNVHYERRFTNMFSIDASIAKPVFGGIDPIEMLFNDGKWAYIKEQEDKPGGIGYGVSLRLNPSRRAIAHYGFYSLNIRHRLMTYEKVDFKRTDYYFASGWKKIYNNNIGLEIMQCIGGRVTNLVDKTNDPNAYYTHAGKVGGFFYNIDIKLGYFF